MPVIVLGNHETKRRGRGCHQEARSTPEVREGKMIAALMGAIRLKAPAWEHQLQERRSIYLAAKRAGQLLDSDLGRISLEFLVQTSRVGMS